MEKLKRVALLLIAITAGLFLTGTLLAWIYKDKVRNLVVESLNNNLKAEIEVEEISFSFFRHFPYASVAFENVRAKEPHGFETTGTILNAKKLSLLFNLAGIFSDDLKLKKIVLSDASLNLQVDENGNTNYEIWKTDSSGTSRKISLELEDVVFENVDVLYYDVIKKQDISFMIISGMLKGNFGSAQYALTSSGNLEHASVKIDEVTYLSDRPCELKVALDVDSDKGLFTFRESGIKLSGLDLKIDGTIQNSEKDVDLDLKITSPGANLPALLSLIPEKFRGDTKGYKYDGKMEFSGSLKGKYDTKNSPLVIFNFKSMNVSLNPEGTPYHLKNMNGTGYFTNRKSIANPVSFLQLSNFSATLEGKPVRATVAIENFTKPRLDIAVVMEADLKALSRFFMPDTLEEISGKLFVDAKFKGIAGEKTTYRSSGDIRFEQVAFRLKQKPVSFSGLAGMLHLDGNDLVVDAVSGKAGSSDFTVSGTFRNLFAWLFLEQQKLDITATLASNQMDLDELIQRDKSVKSVSDTVYRIDFSKELKLQLDVNVKKLKFRKFEAEVMTGSLALQDKVLMTKLLDFNTVGGSVRLKGQIDSRPSDSLKIDYDAMLNQLDINRLFYEMGNFGQQVIVDKNLKGIVKAEVQFRSVWSKSLNINEKSIYAKSDITIENGELINFEPMLALSRFMKGADLRVIKFSTLTNTIEIRNRKIIIPMMEIKSSAQDIIASGEHTFDNIVDYKLRLYLSQLVGKKVRAQNTEFGTIEDDGLGRPMVFLTMKGTASDPKFAIDRKSVEQKITTEIKKETQSLKSILKEEFGTKPAKDPSKPNPPKKQEELQIEYEDE